jgi:hypothetical protein
MALAGNAERLCDSPAARLLIHDREHKLKRILRGWTIRAHRNCGPAILGHRSWSSDGSYRNGCLAIFSMVWRRPMLRPDERQHLLELLRPPAGCKLDIAVGTTFSLDLLSALMLPLSFAFFDWEHEDGELVADPLALLEALRRYGDRFTIFCQSGQIRLPRKYQPLVTFLEPCIYDVKAPDADGVFHPKVWALRFIAEDGAIRYRVLCLSRNLTFDRCWDTVVALDGELTDRSNAIAANHPLADLIAALPSLARLRLPGPRRQGIDKIADELRRVRFTWPEGFDEKECRFWVAGLNGRIAAPFGARHDKALNVSPFISNTVVRDFLDHTGKTHLVSRPECLQELPQETLRDCDSVSFLAPELTDESDEDAPPAKSEVLEGLHAKLFVIDRGWNASVFSGSFNATAQPRRTRRMLRRYLSTWVDWKSSKLGEGLKDFCARALKFPEEAAEGITGSSLPWTLHKNPDHGCIREVKSNSGTVQKDWAVVKSNTLPDQFCIAVVGHQGWSRDPDSTARYALAVSFEVVGQEVAIYEPLKVAIEALEAESGIGIENEVEIEIDEEP